MQPVNLFHLAAQQAKWLTVRQTVVAGNIANANTPGYGAMDVKPFEAILDGTSVPLAATHPRHVSLGGSQAALVEPETSEREPLLPSGNTVVLESELMKSGEVRRSYELNTAIVTSFHRMLMLTTRS